MTGCSNWRKHLIASLFLGLCAPAWGLESVTFSVKGGGNIDAVLRDASLLAPLARGSSDTPQEILSKARAEYGALLDALYGQGHYGGVIRILVDGREAANIALLDSPAAISAITVTVDPGPAFTFDRARVAPLPTWPTVTKGFETGAPAKSSVIVDAMANGIDDWRRLGHAKAKVSQSNIEADHGNQRVTADIALDAGPKLRFGALSIVGAESMRPDRIMAIASLPKGEQFSPAELDRAAQRLRRTGAFRSVVMEEAEQWGPDGSLPITAVLAEERLRRLALNANLASLEGLSFGLSGAHRNLFGGAERLTLSASATRIGIDTGGLDYTLSASFERPATFTADTTFALGVVFDREKEVLTTNDSLNLSSKLTHYYSTTLTGSGGLAYHISRTVDPRGETMFRTLSFPFTLTWDNRNLTKNTTDGVYMNAAVKPFVGFGVTQNGVRVALDARGFSAVTPSGGLVMAARAQLGMILGAGLAGTPREDLFFSGGPSTVRGHPYRSLGVTELAGSDGARFLTGGTHYLGASVEARQRVGENLGLVGFLDAGRIDNGRFLANSGNWHAGAGLGVRYNTAIGPVRLDLAMPVAGSTGSGAQIYIGIGQAF